MSELPWDERITMLSVHPDAASRDDVADLAADLMECRRLLRHMLDENFEVTTEWLEMVRNATA